MKRIPISIFTLSLAFLLCTFALFAQVPEKTKFSFGRELQQDSLLPVTHLRFQDQEDKIQFIIMSDNTGGMIPGVFRKAAQKVSLLQPQLIMSVGDLIDGYTEDPELLNEQWDEFNAIVDSLEMPFFYVPGNHDISNNWMEKEWIERYGSPFYHFVYKNALFLCINTDDQGNSGIKDEQVAYFKKALEENKDVRWTFLFMHRPIWSYGNQEGFEKIASLLEGRPYTLFSAHHHHYLFAKKNGNKHFVLATTGGGSHLRGPQVGEFHHVTQVTLTEGEPKIINLALDGLIDEDIVNEENYPAVQNLRMGQWLKVPPVVTEKQVVGALETTLLLDNPTQYPLQVQGTLKLDGYKIEPADYKLTVAPNSQKEIPVKVSSSTEKAFDLEKLLPVLIKLTGAHLVSEKEIAIQAEKELVIDWKRKLLKKQNVKVDASLQEWDSSAFIKLERPGYFKEDWDWKGTQDALLSFSLAQDEKYLYGFAIVKDEKFITEGEKLKDKFFLFIQGNKASVKAEIQPKDQKPLLLSESKTMKAKTRFHEDKKLLFLEFRLPLKELNADGGQHPLRFNMGYMDHDNPQNIKPSILYWKPLWEVPESFEGSGMFLFE